MQVDCCRDLVHYELLIDNFYLKFLSVAIALGVLTKKTLEDMYWMSPL